MDLVSVDPLLNMYDEQWPIRTYQPNLPAAEIRLRRERPARRGEALDSIVCQGSIISGGQVERSILGPQTRVNSFAHVEDSILFDRVDIGRHCRIRRAIIDKGVHIPPGVEIGFDHELDRRRGFYHHRERHHRDRQVRRRGAVRGSEAISVDRVGETTKGTKYTEGLIFRARISWALRNKTRL